MKKQKKKQYEGIIWYKPSGLEGALKERWPTRTLEYQVAELTPEQIAASSDHKAFLHASYEALGVEIGRLVDEKQEAYGDSFGKAGEVMKLLYPDGIKPEQYSDALCIVRIVDKLFRIATRKDAFGESPYKDIAGYGLLGARKDEK